MKPSHKRVKGWQSPGLSPTARTEHWLRDQGWASCPVERNIAGKFSKDAFGFGDILAFRDHMTLLAQATSGSNHAARVKKVMSCPEAAGWLSSPHRAIWVVSWSKLKEKRTGRRRWTERVTAIALDLTDGKSGLVAMD